MLGLPEFRPQLDAPLARHEGYNETDSHDAARSVGLFSIEGPALERPITPAFGDKTSIQDTDPYSASSDSQLIPPPWVDPPTPPLNNALNLDSTPAFHLISTHSSSSFSSLSGPMGHDGPYQARNQLKYAQAPAPLSPTSPANSSYSPIPPLSVESTSEISDSSTSPASSFSFESYYSTPASDVNSLPEGVAHTTSQVSSWVGSTSASPVPSPGSLGVSHRETPHHSRTRKGKGKQKPKSKTSPYSTKPLWQIANYASKSNENFINYPGPSSQRPTGARSLRHSQHPSTSSLHVPSPLRLTTTFPSSPQSEHDTSHSLLLEAVTAPSNEPPSALPSKRRREPSPPLAESFDGQAPRTEYLLAGTIESAIEAASQVNDSQPPRFPQPSNRAVFETSSANAFDTQTVIPPGFSWVLRSDSRLGTPTHITYSEDFAAENQYQNLLLEIFQNYDGGHEVLVDEVANGLKSGMVKITGENAVISLFILHLQI